MKKPTKATLAKELKHEQGRKHDAEQRIIALERELNRLTKPAFDADEFGNAFAALVARTLKTTNATVEQMMDVTSDIFAEYDTQYRVINQDSD